MTANTKYYIRAYATNNVGTAYGNEVTITTLANPVLPTVTTTTATNITQTSATSGGNVTSDGGSTVTARGVCWNTSTNPTVSNSHTNDGSGLGIFVSTLTELTVNTLYYVRAYATNGVGIAYGNEISFTTDNGPIYHETCGQTYVYYEVSNAGQIWLDRDLGANRVAQSSTDYLAYGHLYQWGRLSDNHQCINWTSSTTGNPVNGTTTILSSSDEPGNPLFITPTSSPYDWRNPQNNDLWQGLLGTNNPCPPGFRIPTLTELGIERSSWVPVNATGAYASPLKIPVSGGRNGTTGAVEWSGVGVYWSSSVEGTNTSQLYFNSEYSYYGDGNRGYGGPIRCIKD